MPFVDLNSVVTGWDGCDEASFDVSPGSFAVVDLLDDVVVPVAPGGAACSDDVSRTLALRLSEDVLFNTASVPVNPISTIPAAISVVRLIGNGRCCIDNMIIRSLGNIGT